MKKFVTAAVFGLTLMGSSALAAPIDVNQQVSGNTFGTENWKVVTSFSASGIPDMIRKNVYAGAFQLTADGLGDFIAFCLQPRANLNLSVDYTAGTDIVDPALGFLNNLAANAFFDVSNAITGAAFQMAVWELAHGTTDFNIFSGDFKIINDGLNATNQANSLAAANQAQIWLDKVQLDMGWADNAFGKNFLILSADGTQDLLTNIDDSNLNEVPLPASGLLLLAGLAGAGAVARRKRKA